MQNTQPTARPESRPETAWKLLVVDDEESVHAVTRLAFALFEFQGATIETLHAMNAAEARELFREHPDIAVALVDVVMETDDAGLELVRFVREELDNREVQMIIRTGQPGYAPEENVIIDYDINDYHCKTDLSHTRLKTAVVTALRNWQNIQRVEEANLARIEAESIALSKSLFLAQMSHEIRTPMNGVLGITELLGMTQLTDQQREYVETIHGSAHALLTVLNDILDFSKIEAGKLELEEISFRLPPLLEELRRLFRAQAQSRGIQLDIQLDGRIPRELIGDPVRLRQILTNLVGNAIKFTSDGNVTIAVREKRRLGDRIELELHVRDTGEGIPADALPNLFTEFRQASAATARTHGGTGLGLAICKRLCELMQGAIAVESTHGEGSDFHFTVILKLADENSNHPARRLRPTMVAQSGRKLRILVAEDNPVNVMIVEGMLENLGLEATIAANGREALEQATAHEFDLILMDCRMPEMDGIEATEKITAALGKQCPPIVAMTAAVTEAEKRECFNAGMCDLLAKPMKMADLQNTLEKWRNGG